MVSRTSLVLPIALVVTVCLGAQALLFTTLTRAQDDIAVKSEQALVSTAVADQVERLNRMLKDYAVWDDAYRNLELRFDRKIADANLGPYLAPVHGIDYSFVLDGEDRTIYATRGTEHTSQTALTSLGGPVLRAISAVRRPSAANDPRAAGFTRVDGKLAMFGVSGIRPSPGSELQQRPGPMTLVIFLDLVDEPMLSALARRYRLSGLFLASDPPVGTASLPLRLYGGEVAGFVAWSPDRPGTMVRDQLLPWLLAISAFVLALAGFAVRIGRASPAS